MAVPDRELKTEDKHQKFNALSTIEKIGYIQSVAACGHDEPEQEAQFSALARQHFSLSIPMFSGLRNGIAKIFLQKTDTDISDAFINNAQTNDHIDSLIERRPYMDDRHRIALINKIERPNALERYITNVENTPSTFSRIQQEEYRALLNQALKIDVKQEPLLEEGGIEFFVESLTDRINEKIPAPNREDAQYCAQKCDELMQNRPAKFGTIPVSQAKRSFGNGIDIEEQSYE